MSIEKKILAGLLFVFYAFAHGQDLDSNFHDNGVIQLEFRSYHEAKSMELWSDSLLYIVGDNGQVATEGFDNDFYVLRLDLEGNRDTSFADSGLLSFDKIGYDYTNCIDFYLNDDGGFYTLSYAYNLSNTSIRTTFLSKYDFFGNLDTSFADSGSFEIIYNGIKDVPTAMDIDAFGNFYICGSAEDQDAVKSIPVVGKWNPEGARDTTFGENGVVFFTVIDGLSSLNTAKVTHNAGGVFNDVRVGDDGLMVVGSAVDITTEGLSVWLNFDGTLNKDTYSNGYVTISSKSGNAISFKRTKVLSNGEKISILKTNDTDNDFSFVRWQDGTYQYRSFDIEGQQDFLEDIVYGTQGGYWLLGRSSDKEDYNSATYSYGVYLLGLGDDFELNPFFGTNGVISYETAEVGLQNGGNLMVHTDDYLYVAGKIYEENQAGIDIGLSRLKLDNVSTNLENIVDEHMIHVYPNPVVDKLFFSNEVESFLLFNSNGRLISEGSGYIDFSGISKGVYVVQLFLNDGRIAHQKVIKN